MEISFAEFDLAIEQTEDGYFARVLASPAGEAVAPFRNPFGRGELEQFYRLLRESESTGLRGAEQQNAIRRQGERLFQALFTPNIRLCWEESIRLATQQRQRLRLRLHLYQVSEFAELPWEYLWDPQQQSFVALSAATPLVRYTDLKKQIVPLAVEPPLRLLVVVANPGGQPMYDEDEAWLSLVDTLDYLAVEGKLLLERLMRPTVHELQRRLRRQQYHLLHFIGHGRYDGLGQEHLLFFEDEMGHTRPVNSQHLGALLSDHFSMRLVTLQACPTAQPDRHNPYLGVAQQLIRRGLPATVALHQTLPPTTTLAFAHQFYRAIAEQMPVDSALSEARRALWQEDQDPSWGTISLFLRNIDTRLFTRPVEKRPPRLRVGFSSRRLS
jgi:CHAT domain-containing protein